MHGRRDHLRVRSSPRATLGAALSAHPTCGPIRDGVDTRDQIHTENAMPAHDEHPHGGRAITDTSNVARSCDRAMLEEPSDCSRSRAAAWCRGAVSCVSVSVTGTDRARAARNSRVVARSRPGGRAAGQTPRGRANKCVRSRIRRVTARPPRGTRSGRRRTQGPRTSSRPVCAAPTVGGNHVRSNSSNPRRPADHRPRRRMHLRTGVTGRMIPVWSRPLSDSDLLATRGLLRA